MPDIPASLRALLSNLIDYAGLFPPAALPFAEVAEKYQHYRNSPDGWMLNRLVLPAGAPLREGWRVSLLVETTSPHRLSLPTYCEVPLDQVQGDCAKIRTGGLTPAAIPTPETLHDFLVEASGRRLPFKATAGLHHPLRSLRPLTYAADSPRAVMHGFLNVFIAAAFAWPGCDVLHWRHYGLTTVQIQAARDQFAHSFGSCSFEEPAAELRELGFLP